MMSEQQMLIERIKKLLLKCDDMEDAVRDRLFFKISEEFIAVTENNQQAHSKPLARSTSIH